MPRAIAARVAGGGLPLLLPFVLAFIAVRVEGESVPTNRIRVLDGPARAAGILSGDRVVSVDARPTASWDSVRSALQAEPGGDGKHVLELERAGARLTISVAPDANRRIGITAIDEQRAISSREAAHKAAELSTQALRLPVLVHEQSELRGPIGIVRATSAEPARVAGLLALAGLTSQLVPVMLLFQLLVALSLLRFALVNPAATREAERSLEWRLAHARQLMIGFMIGMLLLAVVWTLIDTQDSRWLAFGGGALVVFPVWIVSGVSRGRLGSALCVLAILVPVLNWFVIWRLSREARVFLQNRGIRAAWFSARRAAPV
jgi:hypothetical protein